MKSRCLCLLAILLAFAGSARPAEPAAPPPVAKDFPLEAYTVVGSLFAQNARLGDLGWNEAQFEAFIAGVRATFKGQPRVLDAKAQALQEEIARRLQDLAAKEGQVRREQFANPAGLEAYMKEMAKKYHMERADSGLAYAFLSPGAGSRPGPDDSVVVSYEVTAADGTDLPQLTVKQKRVKVAELMPGLAEAVQMMSAGGSAILILPPDLSYGTKEWPAGVDRGTPLLFMVVLDQVIPAP